ncbi:MAG: NFACT family protein [Clostridiales Family XIII bacterium]|jgi:predicted ribosome quality control (RQC) complex YloA/Tae2 family protein|nr:NFACT family protein [Clostridiales Family XIII bacterium]
MSFDNLVTGAVAKELDEALAGGKIERIYQPERDELIFHVNVPPRCARPASDEFAGAPPNENDGEHMFSRTARQRFNLLISSNSSHPLICITEIRSGNPQNPPGFCMLLRKHLLNGRIARVAQVDDERIVRIDIDASNELGMAQKRALIVEIMGKHSNIMLIDPTDSERASGPSGKILDSIKRVYADMSRLRQILPGMAYIPPPPGKGISPIIAEELALRGDARCFQDMARAGAYTPIIYSDSAGEMKDFHVFRLKIYEGMKTRMFPTVSSMIETYYGAKEKGNRLRQKTADVSQALKARLDKLLLKKQRLLEDIQRADEADDYRRKGELLTANIYRMEKGAEEITLTDWAAGPDGEDIEVTLRLDPRRSPAQNAQQYFKKYNKAKTARAAKREQLEKTQEDIDFLESYRVFIENATTDAEIDAIREELRDLGYLRGKKTEKRKPVKKSDLPRYVSSAGSLISVGRNNKENDELTFKRAKPWDIWLHTKDIPGSHVILSRPEERTPRSRGNDRSGRPASLSPSESADLREAAAIAAYYSKARESANVPVDCTFVKYVKKPAGAKPGMVIFTHNRTLYADPAPPAESRK